MKQQETKLMLECLERHYEKVQTLTISGNKIGLVGAQALAKCLLQMKSLTTLDLSHDEIGDQGLFEIITQVTGGNLSIEELDLSGNCIGKNQTYY